MEPLAPVTLSAIGALATAAVTYFGIHVNTRNMKRAQASTTMIERAKVDAEAYESARQIWDAVIADLRRQVGDQRKELTTMHASVEHYRDEINELRNRIDGLEAKRKRLLGLLADNGIVQD